KNTAVETAYAIAVDPLEPPRSAGQLTALIEALLAKEPAERPTAEVVEQALRAAEAEVDTALMGWPTLALGTVGRGRRPEGEPPEAPTRPVTHTGTGPGSTQSPTSPTGSRADTGSTTGSAAGASATTTTGQGAEPVVESRTEAVPRSASGGRRRAVVWGVVGALAAMAIGGGVLYTAGYLGPSKNQESGDAQATSPAAKPKPSPTKLPPTPDGYRRVTEKDFGISFPIPDDWTRIAKPQLNEVDYIDSTRKVNLKISVLGFASADQVRHFEQVEQQVKERQAEEGLSYSRLRLQDTIYRGQPAAIWEYQFMGSVRMYRAIDLGFGREGGNEYAIYLSAPDALWSQYAPVFNAVRDGFSYK
ncbi:serine/threonine protein kinase, partial [Streptomyces sp. NPDC090442]